MDKCLNCRSGYVKKNSVYLFHDVYECDQCGAISYERIDDCCRNPFQIVVKDERKYPLSFIRKQCINCGGCLNMNKPLPNKVYGDSIRGEFNMDRFTDWKASFQDEGKMLYGFKAANEFRNSRYYKYLVYLLSDEWKAKRHLVLERDMNLCQHCKQKPAVDIHHLTYEHLFNEPIEDLLALCPTCHSKVHSKVL